MREMNLMEVEWVSGGGKASVKVGSFEASVEGDPKNLGDAMIDAYEGAVVIPPQVS